MTKDLGATAQKTGPIADAPDQLLPVHLKRCPFCGSHAVFHEQMQGEWSVHCSAVKTCGVFAYSFASREEAGAVWNRRVELVS